MYKYTYLLSQSYRSEAGIEKGREVAGVEARKDLGNVEVGLKVMPRNVVKRKEQYNVGNGNRHVPYQAIEKSFSRVGHGKELNARENVGIDVRSDKSMMIARGSSEMKVKSIAQKYSHQPTLAKNSIKPINSQPFQNTHHNEQQNKAYRQYKELKIAGKEDKLINQYQSNIDHMHKTKQLDYSPINQIKVERQPLRQANCKPTQDQEVNRTKVRSQISSYLQNPKSEPQNYSLASKKYTYITEKQTKQTSVPTIKQTQLPKNVQQSSQTVAKLSSLQQRIKTTIGSYLPA